MVNKLLLLEELQEIADSALAGSPVLCGQAANEIERLRGYLETLQGMAGGLADHAEMQVVIEKALADD